MRAASLQVLKDLIAQGPSLEARGVAREARKTTLLRPANASDKDWFMCVGPRFNAALSIVETRRMTENGATTVWTQGSNFAVQTGDIFYDSEEAYLPWNPALVRKCLAVTFALPVRPASKDPQTKKITRRYPGRVDFEILEQDERKAALVVVSKKTMTQDEFVSVLIRGFDEQLTLT